jgi:pimeloyl-ACP methyl ester carboxylesterase
MLDPPIASGLPGVLFRLAKYSPLIDKISPAGKAAARCKSWALDTDLVEYFSGKALFRHFHKACITDYVSAAIATQDDQQVLRFDAHVEAQIFRNVPHNIHQYYGRMQRPSCLITAQKSQVCTPRFLKSFKRATNIEHIEVPELGHMFPLEAPSLVAQLIQQKITEWENNQ